MTTNKIPTDEEILENHNTAGPSGMIRRRIERPYFLDEVMDLMEKARAAGRAEGAAEQREKDAKIAEKFEPSQKQDYVTYISQAIRTQTTDKEEK